jgi:hypothetical protein
VQEERRSIRGAPLISMAFVGERDRVPGHRKVIHEPEVRANVSIRKHLRYVIPEPPEGGTR